MNSVLYVVTDFLIYYDGYFHNAGWVINLTYN